MKEIGVDELKQIQLRILDAVHEYCIKNGIMYFLSSGTLIGAVRHKGYIPWDDDIDLYMPREDYDCFIYQFRDEAHDLKVVSLETDSNYPQPFAKVIDSRTVLIEENCAYELGVYIDIFPVDGVPSNKLKRKMKSLFLFAVEMLISCKRNSVSRSKRKNGMKRVCHMLMKPIRLQTLLALKNTIIKKLFPEKDAKQVVNYTYLGAGVISKDAISQSVDIEFEGKKYKTMVGYEEYLSQTYGDYMKLPPIEQQVSNHVFKAYWK